MAAKPRAHELDLSGFPKGTVTEYTTLVCLACIFDIFTKQLGLAPRTAFSEIKRHTPTIEELTSRNAVRPYFDSEEKHPHCPYCESGKRWLARFDTYCIEGRKTTDAPRRALIKKLPQSGDQFLLVDKKSDSRAVFFEWLDTLRVNLDLNDEAWLLLAARNYLERRVPETNWEERFAGVRAVRRSNRIAEGWERDGTRLFLAPALYGEALLIQYLVSRSHTHGGLTSEGRLTLMELIRKLRYFGYLDQIGITEREPGEVFEKLIDYLASTHDWSRVTSASGPARGKGVSAGSGSDQVSPSKKTAKKSSKKAAKSRPSKPAQPEPDEIITEPVKLHYLIDRRDFLEKAKSVYASYAA
jgi:predicted DCC family thiol-disulfide oxidoreductase YuxK